MQLVQQHLGLDGQRVRAIDVAGDKRFASFFQKLTDLCSRLCFLIVQRAIDAIQTFLGRFDRASVC